MIALADSQILRWLDELNGVEDADERAREIMRQIRRLRKSDNTLENRRAVRSLYQKLDAIQYKPDYLCLIIDKEKDYWRACEGFSVNGISYKRLLGTNGGIKNSTIVFISERHIDEIRRRIDNGRNLNQKLVPAKLEAYKALVCSASIPVSWPKGILVVKDFETSFREDVIYLTDENDGEPVEEYRENEELTMDACDGYGLILPSLAERWSEEIGLDYVMSGCNSRLSFEKGMLFTFDFVEFAELVAGSYEVEDVWGEKHDIRDIELIFTESMLKIWDGFTGIDQYLENCRENHYTISVTKICPKELEHERALNYQFIQSYKLSDEDIEELIAPTMEEIHDVLGGGWEKTVLYLAGTNVGDSDLNKMQPGIAKAIMADRRVLDDPHVRESVYRLIRNRINEAKVGVLNVHGNYSVLSGDPFALCQSIFGLEPVGLLKAGEIYNRYWIDNTESEELVCFRAPMSVHNNIRRVKPSRNQRAAYWYRYITTATIINCHDSACQAMNGADLDGDQVMLTDNPVLVRRHEKLPTIMCVQRKADKVVPTAEDTIRSNILAFGDEIGKTTNWITSMYEVQSHFPAGSEEVKTLEYRIRVGQLIQQNVIDKAKGIIAKPMPRSWHEKRTVNMIEDEDTQRFYRSIVADRKPYFMRYIYPDLMKQYREYLRKTDASAIREFKITVDEMRAIPYADLTERQKEFLHYYDLGMPVGVGDCVMNRICRRFEEEFDGYMAKYKESAEFDCDIFRSGAPYTKNQQYEIKKLVDEYQSKQRRYALFANVNSVPDDERYASSNAIFEEFKRECLSVCQSEASMCDILIDLLYRKRSGKLHLWKICAETLVDNLLEKNGWKVCVPVKKEDGDITYRGMRFAVEERTLCAETKGDDADEYCAE